MDGLAPTIGAYNTAAKYMEESIKEKNIIKTRHNVLLMISSKNFAVPLYTLLTMC